ncbi:uncharacterized protein LOC135120373 [Zophobas morio]|uniref:uncharacterized protein LOC135120373 n=1 Tax=Zophobas morio TaxID=2755281 RepID=UPI0030828330
MLFDYIVEISPLIFCHLLVPTLEEGPVLTISWPRDLSFLQKNFIYSRANWSNKRYWTALLYMFVHKDKLHLYTNLLGLFFGGYTVHQELGLPGLLIAYLGGGIAGAVETRFKETQLSDRLSLILYLKGDSLITKWINELSKSLSIFIAPRILAYCTYAGASSGVCAVVSLELCLTMKKMYTLLARPAEQRNKKDKKRLITLCFKSALNLLDLFNIIRYSVFGITFHNTDFDWGADHAGHTQGIAFGLSIFVLRHLYIYASSVLSNYNL